MTQHRGLTPTRRHRAVARSWARPLAGVVTILAIVAVVALVVDLFRGGFANTAPVSVLSARAGLVMYPDAKVKLHGAQVGKVDSIEARPDGTAVLHLAIDASAMDIIPANVGANIASSTVFGSKYVELVMPANPSQQSLRAGQVVQGDHVTVEMNTVFEQLVAVLSRIEPAKLNETLGAISKAFDGRGEQFGQSLADIDAALATLDPSLDNLDHELGVAPSVLSAYADAAPDLLKTTANVTKISDTIVERRNDLDAVLVSATGLADIGTKVVAENRQPLTNVFHLLVPTTDLTNEYHPAITCALQGVIPMANNPVSPVPGLMLLQSFFLGRERYRYPENLPKVAATGGPQCIDLPNIGLDKSPPYVVTDIGANQAEYGNQGILLNSEGLKQALFGPLGGPPRNTAQIGQPG